MEETTKKPIDFAQIVKKLWPHRKKYYYVLPATLVLTYLFMLFFPRYYTCTISLAPETSGTSFSGSLGSLASSIGLGSSLAKMNSQDAIFAEIYPEVIASKNFIAELRKFDAGKVIRKRPRSGGEKTTVLMGYALREAVEFLK